MAPSLNSSESPSSTLERKPWRREEKRRYDIKGKDRTRQDRTGQGRMDTIRP
jgi:hypothetical protein